jgi:acyl carrier protein
MSDILDRIQDVVREELEDDGIVLTPDTKASDVDGWDSLAHVRIVIAIESEFGLRFDTGDITSLKTVGDLARLVEVGKG